MTTDQYEQITESVEALEYRLRENARQIEEARARLHQLEALAVELVERIIVAHDR